jgi:hypothetical protein
MVPPPFSRDMLPGPADNWCERCGALDSARCDVAIDLAVRPHEDDPVTGRIALVSFHFLIGDMDPRAVRESAAAVGDDGDVVVAFDLKSVGLERIGLTTTGHRRIIRLHQALEPVLDLRGRICPLTVIAGVGNDAAGNRHKDRRRDERQPFISKEGHGRVLATAAGF